MDIMPLSKLTRLLTVLLRINIGITVCAVLIGIWVYHQYANLAPGVNPDETLFPCDVYSGAIGVVQVIFFLFVVGITFLRWIYRANKNLHLLSQEHMRFSPGWSVGWYFIPIASLFKPYQVMKEIWIVAHRGVSDGGKLLRSWWLLWIASTFFDRIAMRLALQADGVQGHVASALAYLGSDTIDVVLNLVALRMVIAIGKAYESNYVAAAAASSGGLDPALADSRGREVPPSN